MEPDRIPLADIAAALSASLGKEKAEELVRTYAHAAGIVGDSCTFDEAMKMLESMAKADGLLGIVARFAKARWYLAHARPK
ncbi:MAG TPA: hypothetical protein VGH28_02220 [Polyangiaceae bacterium]